MALNFPEKFDVNEWFILGALLGSLLVFLLLPKRLPKPITPLIVLVSISFPSILDHSLAVNPHNLYNLNDRKDYEIFDLILYLVYPAFGYLYVYLLNLLQWKRLKLVAYLLIWTLFSVVFEMTLTKIHVFVLTGWKHVYSLPVYIAVLTLTYYFFIFIMNYQTKTTPQGH